MTVKATLRLRLSSQDTRYGGDLVDGGRILGLFGDVATELLVRLDGDEGLFRAYENVEFLAPVYAGDFLEVEGELISEGKTSRRMRFTARKVIRPLGPPNPPSACELLAQPIEVCRAMGSCVVPKALQRLRK